MKITYLYFILLFPLSLLSQNSKFDTKVYFGVQNNFFVDYDRKVNRDNNYIKPIEEMNGVYDLMQKNSIGTVYGAIVNYNFNENNSIGIDFNRTDNFGKYNIGYTVNPVNYNIDIENMKLKNINNSISLIYGRNNIIKNLNLGLGIGFTFSDMQEITVNGYLSNIYITTRKWTELNVPILINYNFINNNKIKFGIETRANFTPIIGGFENLMLFPFLNISI